MMNYKTVLDALEALLRDNLTGYIITRNRQRNDDPNIAATNKGWIGIYRGNIEYEPARIGTGNNWDTKLYPKIEIQTASTKNETAEDKLNNAEQEILNLLDSNKKISNTVGMTNGYSIEYQVNTGVKDFYHLSAIITINAQSP